eukprot:snap_masked-scaffold347_size200506-processed-gene-0.2 protein:Tk02315 transcript:snap_masked-scaffold347_size200506-processed-gene-0.2-mRNA-1 annotation:"ubiquitin-protein ligase e3b isoform x1"
MASKNSAFLAQVRDARLQRHEERARDSAATLIQASVRGHLVRLHWQKRVRADFDRLLPPGTNPEDAPPALDGRASLFFLTGERFLSLGLRQREPNGDPERLERLCRCALASLTATQPADSYVGVLVNPTHAVAWIRHMKHLLARCSLRLASVRLEVPSGQREVLTLLRMLIFFSDVKTWAVLASPAFQAIRASLPKLTANWLGHLISQGLFPHVNQLLLRGLAGPRVLLSPTCVEAAHNLVLKAMVEAKFSETFLSKYLLNVWSVPAVLQHFEEICPGPLKAIQQHHLLDRCAQILADPAQLRQHFDALDGSYTLCLMANVIHIFSLQEEVTFIPGIDCMVIIRILSSLFESCGHYVTSNQSNLSHWHPVLGWFSVSLDSYLQSSMGRVHLQLARLWSWKSIDKICSPLKGLLEEVSANKSQGEDPEAANGGVERTGFGKSAKFLLKAFERTKTHMSPSTRGGSSGKGVKLESGHVTAVGEICQLYKNAMNTLSQIRLEIISSLSYRNTLVLWLWQLIQSFGSDCGSKQFLDQLALTQRLGSPTPQLQILLLFSDCMAHILTLIDDMEMYEKQEPLKLSELSRLGQFTNQLLFRAISTLRVTDDKGCAFKSLYSMLMIIYARDNRRNFCPKDHWLIRDLKIPSFLGDLEKGKKEWRLMLEKMPHVIPHSDRVQLFRKQIGSDKHLLGIVNGSHASDLITRSTVITIHRNRLVEDGYRQLSTLTSKALKGVIRVKFVNEQGLDEAGIDQDGVFKEFLEETIKRVLGKDHTSMYSYIDELPSLDADLYKSLTYIKHAGEDVSNLDLTFSFDQDMMGKVVNHELLPGGRSICVTNANKINYIHKVAHFRMHFQIKDQLAAFKKGFSFVIKPDWLHLFSTPEVQRLISGDSAPLDLKDLRKHTHYYGGFHDSHRVIIWLWDILEKDFNAQERSAFLRFVTSCSKSPLLGFEYLEPPFSIRCVEVGDDEDDGDTLGSVVRGFLAIPRRDPVNRLPTASTCFNLLKLPNYHKKGTLKEKLKYAITSNTGFELS